MRHRSRTDAESWERFYRRAGRLALASRVGSDDYSYFTSGRSQLAEIAERFRAPPGGTAVEIGCGDGRMTLALADRYDRVFALDVAPTVLAACRDNLQAAGRAGNVTLLLGGADRLALLPAGSVDFVLSATVLQHVSVRDEVLLYLAESGRLLRPGGVAALQLRTPRLRSRVRDVLVDAVRVFGRKLPAFDPSWRGVVLTEAEARHATGRDRAEVSWLVNGHHTWLVVTARPAS
jgi:SAM-dependent methyltransferase